MAVFVPLNAGYTVFVRRTRLSVLDFSPVDPSTSRGVTDDLNPSRGHTYTVTSAIEVSRAACKAEF